MLGMVAVGSGVRVTAGVGVGDGVFVGSLVTMMTCAVGTGNGAIGSQAASRNRSRSERITRVVRGRIVYSENVEKRVKGSSLSWLLRWCIVA